LFWQIGPGTNVFVQAITDLGALFGHVAKGQAEEIQKQIETLKKF